ncbi:MAG: hypothetical protein ACKVIN_03035 [Longimicrobiales bacterium]
MMLGSWGGASTVIAEADLCAALIMSAVPGQAPALPRLLHRGGGDQPPDMRATHPAAIGGLR